MVVALEYWHRVADHPVLAELETADPTLRSAEHQLLEQDVEPAVNLHRERVRPEPVDRRDDPLEPKRREIGHLSGGGLRGEPVRECPLLDRRELAELDACITSHEATEVWRELLVFRCDVEAIRVGLRVPRRGLRIDQRGLALLVEVAKLADDELRRLPEV